VPSELGHRFSHSGHGERIRRSARTGAASLLSLESHSSLFPANSEEMQENPVALPPGRAGHEAIDWIARRHESGNGVSRPICSSCDYGRCGDGAQMHLSPPIVLGLTPRFHIGSRAACDRS
jgi:hypothetical protein